jgi:integrase
VEVSPAETKPVSNAEINRELTVLKRMFTLEMQAGKILHRPHIPMRQEDNVRTGFFEREQFESVRRHLPADLQPVITFAYITGWRIASEVLPMQWRHVDFKAGEVRLDPGDDEEQGRASLQADDPVEHVPGRSNVRRDETEGGRRKR